MRNMQRLSLCTSLLLAGAMHTAFGQTIGPVTTQVPHAKPRVGHPGTTVAPQFSLKAVVDGSFPVENPSGPITTFGVLTDGTLTEPDQNTYVVLDKNPGGPIPGFDYGRHFLFQGHENTDNLAYITRINLDVTSRAHKVTLLTPVGQGGVTGFNAIDGSTYNPFTNTMLFTQEDGGAVIETSVTWPPQAHTLGGILGISGFEGIHPDEQGNLILAEDIGGTTVPADPNDPTSPKVAKQPNSFVYRFVPINPSDLSSGGQLQVLQVLIDGKPVTFHANDPSGDVFSVNQLRMHTPGSSYPFKWITIHDTAVDGTKPFNENQLAKAKKGTPFKRPENLQFAPGSGYQTFYFCPTGDTNSDAATPALVQRGSWGSIFRVDQDPNRMGGTISLFVLGTKQQNSFDNLAFADENTLLATEDRGDGLHAQLNTLDSIWSYTTDGSEPPLRFLALGRDPVSETRGDNEPTGLHVSNGSTDINGQPGTLTNLVGAGIPDPPARAEPGVGDPKEVVRE